MQAAFVAAPARLLHRLGSTRRGMGGASSCPSRAAMSGATSSVESRTRAAIKDNNVMVFSTTYCPYCIEVKSLFNQLGVKHTVWNLDARDDGNEVRQFLFNETGQTSVPNIFIKEKHIGGCDDTLELHSEGKLLGLVAQSSS